MKDIFQILKSSNKELFYSAFFAWLLDPGGTHGLNSQFSIWLARRIQAHGSIKSIETERRIPFGRLDIVVTTESNTEIAIENKTKSIGRYEQIERYKASGHNPVLLGLLKENYPRNLRDKVIMYSEIHDALKEMHIANSELSILTKHFIVHLDRILQPFEIMSDYCCGNIDLDTASTRMNNVDYIECNENDKRFFHAIYFERLISYLEESEPSLIFGTDSYWNNQTTGRKPFATAWQISKDLQGAAFCECIIYDRHVPGKLQLRDDVIPATAQIDIIDLSPRIELSSNIKDILKSDTVGIFQLGCWDNSMRSLLKSNERFNSRGSRNFHYTSLSPRDLVYSHMARLIRQEMDKVWNFPENFIK